MILAEAEVPGWRLLIPLPQEIVWSAVFLLIFALVFIRFVLPRMNAVLDERSEKIEGGIRHAEQAQAQADQLKADQEQELAAARQEAASIRDKARQDEHTSELQSRGHLVCRLLLEKKKKNKKKHTHANGPAA